MKVKELLDILGELDPEAEVFVGAEPDGLSPLIDVFTNAKDIVLVGNNNE